MEPITRLTPDEACAFLGCRYDFLLKEVRAGRVPHYRLGKRVMFTREALSAWIAEQEKKSGCSSRR